MASPTTTRNLKDATLAVTAALPNAGNTVNSNGIDLGSTAPYPVTEKFTVKISTTAANGSNSKNINIRIMDSADNTTFANVATIGNPVLRVTDNANAGFPAGAATIQLPPGIQRYIRATALGEANGGDASAGTFSLELLF